MMNQMEMECASNFSSKDLDIIASLGFEPVPLNSDDKFTANTNEVVKLTTPEKVDGVWRDLGIAAPARRALVDAKILKIKDLNKWIDQELLKLHGMGPSAIKILKKIREK